MLFGTQFIAVSKIFLYHKETDFVFPKDLIARAGLFAFARKTQNPGVMMNALQEFIFKTVATPLKLLCYVKQLLSEKSSARADMGAVTSL